MLTSIIEKIAANLLSGVLITAAAGGTVVGANIVTNGAIEQILPVAVIEVIDLPGGEDRSGTLVDDDDAVASESPAADESLPPSPDATASTPPAVPESGACPDGYRVDKVEQEGAETSWYCRLNTGAIAVAALCPDEARLDKVERDASGAVTSFRCKLGDDDDGDADDDSDDSDGSDDDSDDSDGSDDDDSGSDDDDSGSDDDSDSDDGSGSDDDSDSDDSDSDDDDSGSDDDDSESDDDDSGSDDDSDED